MGRMNSTVVSDCLRQWWKGTIWDSEETEEDEFFDREQVDHVRQEHGPENKYVRP
jgi:hypothetical protein